MADEAPQGAVEVPGETPAAPAAEPRNIREAIAQRRAAGVPEFVTEPEPVETPAAPVTTPEEAALADLTTPAAPAPPQGETTPPAAPPADPYAEFGGRDEVENAVTVAHAMRTEQGMRLIIAQGLTALGYQPDQVRAALEGQGATPAQAATATAEATPAAPADPWANVADDEVVTGADLKAIVQQAIAQQTQAMQAQVAEASQPLQQAVEAQQNAARMAVVDSTLVELLGPPPADPTEQAQYQTLVNQVVANANAGLDTNQWNNPAYVRSQVIRGHQAMVDANEAQLRAYAAKKLAAKEAAPAHIGGTQVPAGSEAPEPRTVKEAIAMRKAMGIV